MMVSKSLSNSIKRFLKKNNLMAVKRMKITITKEEECTGLSGFLFKVQGRGICSELGNGI